MTMTETKACHFRTKARIIGDLAGILGYPDTKARLDELSEVLHCRVRQSDIDEINRFASNIMKEVQIIAEQQNESD